MVSIGVKKKVSSIIQKNISNNINKIIPKLGVNSIYSKVLIYYYCKKKNIKYNDKICQTLKYFENINNDCQYYPLSRPKLILRTLIDKFNSCKLKKCYLCNPLRKFITERRVAESLINLKKK